MITRVPGSSLYRVRWESFSHAELCRICTHAGDHDEGRANGSMIHETHAISYRRAVEIGRSIRRAAAGK